MAVSVPKLKECGVNFQASLKRPGTLRRTARQFLLTWSCFGTRIIRDMTLHSAVSFGNLHYKQLSLSNVVWLFKLINTDSTCVNITVFGREIPFPSVPLSRLFDFTVIKTFFTVISIDMLQSRPFWQTLFFRFQVISHFIAHPLTANESGQSKCRPVKMMLFQRLRQLIHVQSCFNEPLLELNNI